MCTGKPLIKEGNNLEKRGKHSRMKMQEREQQVVELV